MHEILSKKGIHCELKTGFLLLEADDNKHALWHCWITVDNNEYDLTKTVCKLIPETAKFKRTLSDSVPTEYGRTDMDNESEIKLLELNIELINIYKLDPKKFWETIGKSEKINNESKIINGESNVDFDNMKKFRDEIFNMF